MHSRMRLKTQASKHMNIILSTSLAFMLILSGCISTNSTKPKTATNEVDDSDRWVLLRSAVCSNLSVLTSMHSIDRAVTVDDIFQHGLTYVDDSDVESWMIQCNVARTTTPFNVIGRRIDRDKLAFFSDALVSMSAISSSPPPPSPKEFARGKSLPNLCEHYNPEFDSSGGYAIRKLRDCESVFVVYDLDFALASACERIANSVVVFGIAGISNALNGRSLQDVVFVPIDGENVDSILMRVPELEIKTWF